MLTNIFYDLIQYDLFVINLVLRLLRDEYPQYALTGKLAALEGAVASAALFGSVIGQVVAGTLADVIGRKKIFIATAVLIIVGCFGSASSMETPLLTVYGQIACWRFFLGAGVGGEYPLAATVTSESSSASRRGALMAAVFAMQGVGSLLSVLVVIVCLSLQCSSGFTWRFSLAFGAVPVLIAFPWRMRMHETETFEKVQQNRRDVNSFQSQSYGSLSVTSMVANSRSNSQTSLHRFAMSGDHADGSKGYSGDYVIGTPHSTATTANKFSPEKNAQKLISGGPSESAHLIPKLSKLSTGDHHTHSEGDTPEISFSRYAEMHRAWMFYKWHIFGTAASWFLLDIVFYANGLFNHDITALILSPNHQTTSLQDAKNSLCLCLIGVPGYWLAVLGIDSIGRKSIQFNGFLIMALLFTICGLFHDWFVEPNSPPYRKWMFLLLYSLTFLFSNFGPNTTTFVIPGEIYPPEVKATCHGLSAASGKLGAAAGAYLFPMILNNIGVSTLGKHSSLGLRLCFFICAFVAVLGAIVTYFFIPTYGARDLEDPDVYLALDHDFVRPSDQTITVMRQTMQAKAAPYTMIEIIDSADNYCLPSSSGH